jgi:hypothetical protein
MISTDSEISFLTKGGSRMKQWKSIGLVLVIACAVLTVPMMASAQEILSYTPTEYDFGDVITGSAQSQIFTITITDEGPVFLCPPKLVADNSEYPPPYTGNSFVITRVDDVFIPPASSFECEVTFSPTSLGFHQAYLRIESDDAHGLDDLRIPISGYGVRAEPPPQEVIAEILTFMTTAVSDATLQGSGPGSSADGRLKALMNMIEAAGDLMEDGAMDQACQQLLDAYNRTDSDPKPPDFVEGASAMPLAEMVMDLMESIACE